MIFNNLLQSYVFRKLLHKFCVHKYIMLYNHFIEHSAVSYLQNLYTNNEDFTGDGDFFIIKSNDGKQFICHSFLMKRSLFFATCLSSENYIEQNNATIEMQSECSTEQAVNVLHRFLYGLSTEMGDLETVKNVIALSDLCLMNDLKNAAISQLYPTYVNKENVLELVQFCLQHRVPEESLTSIFEYVTLCHKASSLINDGILKKYPALLSYCLQRYSNGLITTVAAIPQPPARPATTWCPQRLFCLRSDSWFQSSFTFTTNHDLLLHEIGICLEPGVKASIEIQISRGANWLDAIPTLHTTVEVPSTTRDNITYVPVPSPISIREDITHTITVSIKGRGCVRQMCLGEEKKPYSLQDRFTLPYRYVVSGEVRNVTSVLTDSYDILVEGGKKNEEEPVELCVYNMNAKKDSDICYTAIGGLRLTADKRRNDDDEMSWPYAGEEKRFCFFNPYRYD